MTERREQPLYPEGDDLSLYANNVVQDENIKSMMLTIEQEKKSISVDVFNRYSAVLGAVKIERF